MALPQLKELRLTIRRPNTDDVSGDLASEFEERLRCQNAEEYQESIKSKDSDGLKPDDRTKKLAVVAAENGEVSARSVVNGAIKEQNTSESPLKEAETFKADEDSPYPVFRRVAARIIELIRAQREAVKN